MNARTQMSMAMQLSSELGRMTQSYNTRLAQLLRSHDVLECFSDWPEEKLDTFADQIRIFRTWLEENRV